jgi:hypothetical protein
MPVSGDLKTSALAVESVVHGRVGVEGQTRDQGIVGLRGSWPSRPLKNSIAKTAEDSMSSPCQRLMSQTTASDEGRGEG